jgi:hypothetical protein
MNSSADLSQANPSSALLATKQQHFMSSVGAESDPQVCMECESME